MPQIVLTCLSWDVDTDGALFSKDGRDLSVYHLLQADVLVKLITLLCNALKCTIVSNVNSSNSTNRNGTEADDEDITVSIKK